jgi:sec-independent protein translocase protein TatB
MDILGIGFPELVFIMIIAMMVFGPRRLPEIAAKAGKMVADLRNMSQGLMTEWQREIAIAAQMEDLEQARRDLGEIKDSVMETGKSISAGTSAVAHSIAPPTLRSYTETPKNNNASGATPVSRDMVIDPEPLESSANELAPFSQPADEPEKPELPPDSTAEEDQK